MRLARDLGGWGWLLGWGWGGEVTSQGELANNSGKGREGGREAACACVMSSSCGPSSCC